MRFRQRLQNKVAASVITLPAAAVLATFLWWLPQGEYSNESLAGWIVYALTTYVLIELSNVNMLLRIRSRLISSLFLTLLAVCGFVHQFQTATLVSFAMVLVLYILFSSYEQRGATTQSFHVYLLLSLGSFAYPPLLLLQPVLLLCQAVFMRSVSLRSFIAGIMGLLVPYWFWAAACLVQTDFMPLYQQWMDIIEPINTPILAVQSGEPITASFWLKVLATLYSGASIETLNYNLLSDTPLRLVPLAAASVVVGLLGLTGFIHYMRKHYDDKIKVRMCFHTILTIQVVLTFWLLFQPRQLPYLFPLLLMITAPAAAHFFALTHTVMTNLWFVTCLLLLVAVGLASLAMPYFMPETTPIIPVYNLQEIMPAGIMAQ